MKKGLVIRCLEVLERWMYRCATQIVTVGEGYKRKICERFNRPERISVVTNGVDPSLFPPRDPDPAFLDQYGLTDKFVCAYVGTIGMAHGLDIVLRAAAKLRSRRRDDIHFLLVGDGARRSSLAEEVSKQGLGNWITLTGRLAKEEMPRVIASSHAIFVHLKSCDLFETVIPSKIFEAMAMNRPILLGVKGESAEIVEKSQSGLLVQPDDEDSLISAITRLADDPHELQHLQTHGRAFVIANYSRDVLAKRMLDILEQVVVRARPVAKQADHPTSS